jgi:hypothetical protein
MIGVQRSTGMLSYPTFDQVRSTHETALLSLAELRGQSARADLCVNTDARLDAEISEVGSNWPVDGWVEKVGADHCSFLTKPIGRKDSKSGSTAVIPIHLLVGLIVIHGREKGHVGQTVRPISMSVFSHKADSKLPS